MRVRNFWVCIGLLVSGFSYAQTPVEVKGTANDPVGQRLVFYFKESIRSSGSFRLAVSEELGIQVRIVTLDPSDGNTGYSTVYSAVWTWNNPKQIFPVFLTSQVGICGASRARGCAEDLLVVTDKQREDFVKLLQAVSGK